MSTVSLVAEPLSVPPRVRVEVSSEVVSGVAVRTNLVTNPSFETNTTGWGKDAGSTISRVISDSYVGTASLQVATTALDGRAFTDPTITVSASTTYTASLWVKGESGKTFNIRLTEYTSTDTIIGETNASTVTATGSWQRLSVTRTFGSTGVRARVFVVNKTSGAHTFYVDAVQLEVGATASDYFDGSTTDANGTEYAWSGTAHASTSTATAQPITSIDIRRDGETLRSLPTTGFTTLVTYDYEATYETPATYVATITTSTGVETLTATTTLTSNTAWIIHPRQPSLSFPVSKTGDSAFLTAIGTASAPAQAAKHRVIGASRDVIMSYGKRSDATYPSFELTTTSEGESRALASLLQDETPVLIRIPASWDADFVEGFFAVETWNATPIVDKSGNWYTTWNLPLSPAVAPKVIVQADNSYAAGLLIGTYADSLAIQPTYYDRLVS